MFENFLVFSIILLITTILIILSSVYLIKARKNKIYENDILINEIKLYMETNHPDIQIEYNFAQKDKELNQMSVVENVILQFISAQVDLTPRFRVAKSELWATYDKSSIPFKNKFPSDLLMRKETILSKDGKQCRRCGHPLSIEESNLYLLKSLENNGTYHFENLALLCRDCNVILNTEKEKMPKVIDMLDIYKNLTKKAIVEANVDS